MSWLTIALAKGRLEEEVIKILIHAGYGNVIDSITRKLIFVDEMNKIKYLVVKPVDVATYVERGVADLGFVGKDSLLEQEKDVYELMDLELGNCIFAAAGFPGTLLNRGDEPLKIATKYPNITSKYFQNRQPIELIYLNGSVELAPIVGMSDIIVDLVETGSTLKANGLVILEKMIPISARIISNRVSYRFNHLRISQFLEKVKKGKDAYVGNFIN
ncbi:ATP phosphoribosyltransferase [Gottfriedia luciferensis]|uniref:ATP phosphoribosyltransferase n=1 Tax=Gottfriedia luciferensis TaxID=178774 RepID=UPI000B450710|nr:ATP phosphoribosyltransferase [Gottfriedia luciferensis]